eukprot:1663734-Prymnesium_polylepis.1
MPIPTKHVVCEFPHETVLGSRALAERSRRGIAELLVSMPPAMAPLPRGAAFGHAPMFAHLDDDSLHQLRKLSAECAR